MAGLLGLVAIFCATTFLEFHLSHAQTIDVYPEMMVRVPDQDSDGTDDLIVYDRNGSGRFYYMVNGRPTPGPILPAPSGFAFSLADTPVYDSTTNMLFLPSKFSGKPMFAPRYQPPLNLLSNTRVEVVTSLTTTPVISTTFQITPQIATTNASLRIAERRGGGVLAVGTDSIVNHNGGIQVWELTTFTSLQIPIPTPAGALSIAGAADIEQAFTLNTAADEYHIVYSSKAELPGLGFGFQVYDGNQQAVTSEQWWSSWPALKQSGLQVPSNFLSPVPLTNLFPVSPLSQLIFKAHDYKTGINIDGAFYWAGFQTSAPPHLNLYSPMPAGSTSGNFFPDAVADYDGDGGDDVVYVSQGTVWVANVELTRTYSQPIQISGAGVIGGVSGDFDGDGNVDLLLGLSNLNLSLYSGGGSAPNPLTFVY